MCLKTFCSWKITFWQLFHIVCTLHCSCLWCRFIKFVNSNSMHHGSLFWLTINQFMMFNSQEKGQMNGRFTISISKFRWLMFFLIVSVGSYSIINRTLKVTFTSSKFQSCLFIFYSFLLFNQFLQKWFFQLNFLSLKMGCNVDMKQDWSSNKWNCLNFIEWIIGKKPLKPIMRDTW